MSELENVASEKMSPELKEQVPDEVSKFLDATKGASETTPLDLNVLTGIFKDQSVIENLKSSGLAVMPNMQKGGDIVIGAGFDAQGQMISTAAAVPRNPGRSEDYLREVADFSAANADRTTMLDLYDRVYSREGIVNNAINKSAALIAMEGEFKVRYVKGKRGVSSDQRAEELRKLLQFWQENVNARSQEGAVKGDRGLRTFMAQGVRLVLKQGDHFGRQVWDGVEVPVLGKAYELPISLQTFDARTIEIPDGLEGTDIELYYWVPPREFIQMLQNPRDTNVKEYLDKAIPPEVQSELIANGQFLLDPELMIHIKHRGTATSNFGESMVEPALNEIAYKRALQALDIVTIENLINRLVIIMVGSDDPNSIYHKQEVSSARMAMMSNMLRRVGPAATIIWPGPDIEVKEVGAYNKVLEMDERYKQAEIRIRNALGVPSALLTGDTSGGKAAGWAAIVGLAAELSEIQEQYKQVFRSIAERIALENGFEDVDVVWEFNQALLTDKSQHVDMVIQMAKNGVISLHSMLSELGFSFETEEVRMAYDVEMGYREMPFGPLRALENNMSNESGDSPEGEDGRPTSPNETDPREDTETTDTQERT